MQKLQFDECPKFHWNSVTKFSDVQVKIPQLRMDSLIQVVSQIMKLQFDDFPKLHWYSAINLGGG